MSENNWLANAEKTWNLAWKSPWLIAASVLSDIVFLFLIGVITTPFRELLVEKIVMIGAIISRNVYATTSVLQQALLPESRPLLAWVVILWLCVLLITYLLYSFLQGSAWFCCSRVAHNSRSWWYYVRRFALMNLFWIGVYAVLHLLDVYLSLRQRFLVIATQSSVTNTPGILFWIVSSVLGLIAVFSYATQNLGAGFHLFFDFRISGPLVLILAVLGLNLDFLLAFLGRLHPALLVVAGVLILLPLIALARVYIILISEKKHVGS
ncbi:MAG: hypothetical protein Q7K43_05345 [Candidatus Woesearchaeota archaeon]|nr:hypothetical protein [Candidatus Woesearchaeota archaeon]